MKIVASPNKPKRLPSRLLGAALFCVALLSLPCDAIHAEDLRIAKSVSQYFRLVDFYIESGAIVCRKRNDIGTRATSRAVGHESKREERLTIDLEDLTPTVEYESKSPTLRLTLAFRDGRHVAIRREPLGDSPWSKLTFIQNADGGVVLTVGNGAATRGYEAADLWRLLLAEPDLCRDELLPLLKLVPLNLEPAEFAGRVEQSLVHWARHHSESELARWQELVTQLGSPKFAERQAAERNLQQFGERLFPLFDRLDADSLDAEQRFRIRRLRESTALGGVETPQRVAQRLSGSPEIWLALMTRPDAARRTLAAQQLVALLHRPIDFTPEAAADTRAKQIAVIREQLKGR